MSGSGLARQIAEGEAVPPRVLRRWLLGISLLTVLMLMIGLSLPYILTHGGDDRYRAGLIPVLMVLIAYLFIELFAAFKNNRKRIAASLSNV